MDPVSTEAKTTGRFLAWEDKPKGKHEFDGHRVILGIARCDLRLEQAAIDAKLFQRELGDITPYALAAADRPQEYRGGLDWLPDSDA